MTIIWSEAVATIFSCKSAAPPPLISASWGSNSSAPSIVRSSHLASSRLVTGMPRLRASSAVRVEVGTPITRSPSSRMRSARQRTIQAAVEPVPRPTFMPSCTKSTARFAATNLAVSMGDRSAGMGESFPGLAAYKAQALPGKRQTLHPGLTIGTMALHCE